MIRSLLLVGALWGGAHLSLHAQQPTLVRDFRTGVTSTGLPRHGDPNTFLVHNDRLHLFADDGSGLPKLFALDDLSGDMEELAQIGAPMISSTYANFVGSGDNLYFIVFGVPDYTLYKVDENGPTAIHSAPFNLFFGYTLIPMPNGGLVFPGYDPEAGYEPWYTDGTPDGTYRLMDINPGAGTGLGDPAPTFNGFAFDGKAYFLGADGENGVQLWSSDGTQAGTSLFAMINDPDDSGAIALHWSRNDHHFIVRSVNGLLSSDGTEAGTTVLFPTVATPKTPKINEPVSPNGTMYFVGSDNGVSTLFATDGVTNVALLTDNVMDVSLSALIELGDMHYSFVLDENDALSLGRIDPATNTLSIVTNFSEFGGEFPGLNSPNGFRSDGQYLYFAGALGGEGTQYWMSDGTAVGTRKVYHFAPTVGNGGPNAASGDMIVFQGQFVYAANDPDVGRELFTGIGVVGINETAAAIGLQAWASGAGLLDLRVEEGQLRHVRILDMAGRTVLEQGMQASGRATLHHGLAMGVYTVQVTTAAGPAMAKVLLY